MEVDYSSSVAAPLDPIRLIHAELQGGRHVSHQLVMSWGGALVRKLLVSLFLSWIGHEATKNSNFQLI